MELGFIGLGKMGNPMVLRLLAAGHSVRVHNRSRAPMEELAARGAHPTGSASELAAGADVVLTSLPTPASVAEVYDELGGSARSGQLYVDHSTVSPGLSRKCADLVRAKGADFLDAPVSGGPAGAASGTLTIMVGGDEAVYERAIPILRAYGQNIRLCGPVGSGQVVKLVNQLLVAVHTVASAEATVFGVKLGADPKVLLEVLGTSFGGSTMLVRNLPRFISRDFAGATPVALILKDLGLVQDEAAAAGTPLLLGSLAQQLFVEASSRGMSGDDMSSLVRLAEEAAGLKVGDPPRIS
jgi:3-hydroxyisobutyrate dehydrogenase-like beta-hydroxyacid dehydrogenase